MIYSSWDIECDRLKLLILGHFSPYNSLPKIPKNQNFEKMKKSWWRYHFTHLYQKPQSYEVYSSWDMEHDRQNFWSFWAIFYPFPPLTNQKIKIFKTWIKKKKCLEISIILHLCTTNHDHKMHGSWDMECDRHIFLQFWATFCPFTH